MEKNYIDYEMISEKYDPVLSNTENAERIGITLDQLINWKRLNGLIKIGEIDEELFYKYYKLKYVDRMIGKLLGVSTVKIWKLRQVFGLPANNQGGIRYKPTKQKVERTRLRYFDNCPQEEEMMKADSESLFWDDEFIKKVKKWGRDGDESSKESK